MEPVLRYMLTSPSLTDWMQGPAGAWIWSFCETFHFIGLCLLVGIVGTFDLRMLGVAKGLPLVVLKRLIPWAVLGFGLCLATGLVFVEGVGANLFGANAYDVIAGDIYQPPRLLPNRRGSCGRRVGGGR